MGTVGEGAPISVAVSDGDGDDACLPPCQMQIYFLGMI
jgi:hypothetical protein